MAAASEVLKEEGNTEQFHLEIRAELDHICASPAFRTSRRSIEFLQFVVRATLEGREDSLKERSIAMDLLGRSLSYDPASDAIVRVRANDVRRRLASFYTSYTSASADGCVKIALPTGTYVPSFIPAETLATEPESSIETHPAEPSIRGFLVGKRFAIAVFALALFAVGLPFLQHWLHAQGNYQRFWTHILSGKKMILLSMSEADRDRLASGLYPLAWIAGRYDVPAILSTGPLTGATTDTFAKARISQLPPPELQAKPYLHWRLHPQDGQWFVVRQDLPNQHSVATDPVPHAVLLTILPEDPSILYIQSTDQDMLRKILEQLTAQETFPAQLRIPALGRVELQVLLTADATGHSRTQVWEQRS